MNLNKFKKFDILVDKDGDVGIVFKKSKTFLHNHLFIKIRFFSYSSFNESVEENVTKFYEHDIIKEKIKIIGNLKKNWYKE